MEGSPWSSPWRVVRGVVRRVVRGAGSVGSPRVGGQSFLLSHQLVLQCRTMRQTLSNLTTLPHRIKTAVPN